MENILFLLITISFFALMFAHIYLTNSFFKQLKQKHELIWKTLGHPQWKIHFGDDSFKNAMKYIRQKQFTDLQDDVLNALFKKIKNVERIALALALLILLFTIIDVVLEG